jgi:hypothetical protein
MPTPSVWRTSRMKFAAPVFNRAVQHQPKAALSRRARTTLDVLCIRTITVHMGHDVLRVRDGGTLMLDWGLCGAGNVELAEVEDQCARVQSTLCPTRKTDLRIPRFCLFNRDFSPQ